MMQRPMPDKKQAVHRFLDGLPEDQRKAATWKRFSSCSETKMKRCTFQYHKGIYLKQERTNKNAPDSPLRGAHDKALSPLSDLGSYDPIAEWILKNPKGTYIQCKTGTGFSIGRTLFDRVRGNPEGFRGKPYVYRPTNRISVNGKSRKPVGFNVIGRFEMKINEDKKEVIRQMLESLSCAGFNHLQAGVWRPIIGGDEGKEIVELREAIR